MMPAAEETHYTTAQAASILGLSDRRVRQMLEAGELEGRRDNSGKWWIPQSVIQKMLEERGPREAKRRPPSEVPQAAQGDIVGSSASLEGPLDVGESVRELMARVEDLSYRLGRSEARAELTERAESTLREERERLLRELERERTERRRLAERIIARLKEEQHLFRDKVQSRPLSQDVVPKVTSETPTEPLRWPTGMLEGVSSRGTEVLDDKTSASPEEPSAPRLPWWKRLFR